MSLAVDDGNDEGLARDGCDGWFDGFPFENGILLRVMKANVVEAQPVVGDWVLPLDYGLDKSYLFFGERVQWMLKTQWGDGEHCLERKEQKSREKHKFHGGSHDEEEAR